MLIGTLFEHNVKPDVLLDITGEIHSGYAHNANNSKQEQYKRHTDNECDVGIEKRYS